MTTPILVTGAAGHVGRVCRKIAELRLKQGKAVRAMVRNEDERAQALRDTGAQVVVGGRRSNRSANDWVGSPQQMVLVGKEIVLSVRASDGKS